MEPSNRKFIRVYQTGLQFEENTQEPTMKVKNKMNMDKVKGVVYRMDWIVDKPTLERRVGQWKQE